MTEYCALWTSVDSTALFGHEALFLALHPQAALVQSMRAKVVRMLERRLVDAVCDVGVDINRALSLEHYGTLLPFVAGLGLRKTDQLKKRVASSRQRVDDRMLLSKFLGPVVFLNCAGFVRITNVSEGLVFNPLENTRIHPELYRVYNFAPKIVADAMDHVGDVDCSDPSSYVPLVSQLMADVRSVLRKRIDRHPYWLDCWKEAGDTDLALRAGPMAVEASRP
ncbi:MAG: hypothetical protein EOO70_09450, partial [Myxococcaceae bacterium]